MTKEDFTNQSKVFFESAWPALIGWTAGACILLYYVPQLLIANYLWISQSLSHEVVMPFPIEATDILNIVYLLFGFGVHNIIKSKLKE